MKNIMYIKFIALCLAVLMGLSPVTAFANSLPIVYEVNDVTAQFTEIEQRGAPLIAKSLLIAAQRIIGESARVKAGSNGLVFVNGAMEVRFSGTTGNIVARMTSGTGNGLVRIWDVIIR